MKTSAECFSNQIKKLEALIKKFVSTKNYWQRLERVLRSKHSGAEVCKKYVGFTISSAPVPRCGNRFSDRSRKSEGVQSEKCEQDRYYRNKKRNSCSDKSRDNVEITKILHKGGIYVVGVPRKSGGI